MHIPNVKKEYDRLCIASLEISKAKMIGKTVVRQSERFVRIELAESLTPALHW
jgi:hypothetical protein